MNLRPHNCNVKNTQFLCVCISFSAFLMYMIFNFLASLILVHAIFFFLFLLLISLLLLLVLFIGYFLWISYIYYSCIGMIFTIPASFTIFLINIIPNVNFPIVFMRIVITITVIIIKFWRSLTSSLWLMLLMSFPFLRSLFCLNDYWTHSWLP